MFLSSAEERGVFYSLQGGQRSSSCCQLVHQCTVETYGCSIIWFYTYLSLNDWLRNKRNKDEDIVILKGLHSRFVHKRDIRQSNLIYCNYQMIMTNLFVLLSVNAIKPFPLKLQDLSPRLWPFPLNYRTLVIGHGGPIPRYTWKLVFIKYMLTELTKLASKA